MSDSGSTPVSPEDIKNIKILSPPVGTPVPANMTGDIQVQSPTTSAPSQTPSAQKPDSLLTELGHGAEDVGSAAWSGIKAENRLAESGINEAQRVGSRVAEGFWRTGTDVMMGTNPATMFLPIQVDHAISSFLNIPADEIASLRQKYTSAPKTTAGNIAENLATLAAGAVVPLGDIGETGSIAGELSEDGRLQSTMVQMGFKPIPKEAPVMTAKTKVAKTLQGLVNFKGKATAAHNIKRAEELARNEFGLPEDTPLTPDTWMHIREEQGLVSEEARKLHQFSPTQEMSNEATKVGMNILQSIDENPYIYGTASETAAVKAEVDAVRSSLTRPFYSGNGIVDAMKAQRNQADIAFNSTGKAQNYQLADIHKWAARIFEDEIGRQSALPEQADVTSPGLADRLRQARQTIAKTYDYEGAMHNGRLSARTLARVWARFHRPLTGNALMIAQFANRLPQSFADTALRAGEDSHQVLRSLGMYELLRYADPKLLMAYAGEKGLGKLAQSDMLQATPAEIEAAARIKRGVNVKKAVGTAAHGFSGLAAEEGSQD